MFDKQIIAKIDLSSQLFILDIDRILTEWIGETRPFIEKCFLAKLRPI